MPSSKHRKKALSQREQERRKRQRAASCPIQRSFEKWTEQVSTMPRIATDALGHYDTMWPVPDGR